MIEFPQMTGALLCVAALIGLLFRITRHSCVWETLSTDYSPPKTFQSFTGSPEDGRRITEGVTHVYLRCKSCGALKEQDVLGRFDPTAKPPTDSELAELRRMTGL